MNLPSWFIFILQYPVQVFVGLLIIVGLLYWGLK